MAKILKFIGLSLIFLTLILVALIMHLRSFDWQEISMKESPNGQYQIHYYRSGDDGVGQAPYGDHLQISRSDGFFWNNKEETIFAGYCKRDVGYKWQGNEEILIICDNGEGSHRVLLSQIYGIKINLADHKSR